MIQNWTNMKMVKIGMMNITLTQTRSCLGLIFLATEDTGGDTGHELSVNTFLNTGGFKTQVAGQGMTTQFYR